MIFKPLFFAIDWAPLSAATIQGAASNQVNTVGHIVNTVGHIVNTVGHIVNTVGHIQGNY